jgi:hypothetical protein
MKSCERFWNSNLMKMFGKWQPIKIKPFTNEQLFFGAYINKQNKTYPITKTYNSQISVHCYHGMH